MDNMPELAPFLKNPDMLIKLCLEVISRLERDRQTSDQRENETQLREIARTIERLEKARVKVPNTLRAEKTSLAAALSVAENANKDLEKIMLGLNSIVNRFSPQRKIINKQMPEIRNVIKRSNTRMTDGPIFRDCIIKALRKLGGSAHVKDVLTVVADMLAGKFYPRDLEQRESTKAIVWQNNAQWERLRMVQDGILKANSPKGVWELSKEYL